MGSRFERAYGPTGDWAQLFARYPGHGGTTLVRDASNPRRFLAIDSWDTEEQRSHMLAEAAADYDRLDALFGELTESEVELGSFKTVSPKSR